MKQRELLEIATELYTQDELLEIELAIDFATHAHHGQKRKSGEPYITHPLSVAGILIDWTMDIDTILAGILHDTVEDTDATLEEIENLFGADVAFLVDGVTKVGQARSGMQNLESYLPQTTDNLSKLLIAVSNDVRVIIIKLADRLHNLRTLQHMKPDKQKKIAKESLEVFGPIADRLGMGQVRMQIEELAFSFLNPEEFKRLKNQMKKRLGRSTRKLGVVRLEVEERLKTENIAFEMNGRVKSIYSLHKKLQKVEGNFDDVYDLIALRVIVADKETCYQVLGILHSLYQPMIARIKDYIAVPKPNGYQSLHTTVITPNKQIVEFQVRTHQMHEYAERGLAASFHYHEQKSHKNYTKNKATAELPPQLQWITRLQDIAQQLQNHEEISHEQLSVDLFQDRIFVYSPKGDIYNLPENALPLDFAYLLHSDIGKHAYACKVNGNIHPFDRPLMNGNVVEIVTRATTGPKKEWLNLVKTSHAKNKIRQQLKQLGLLEGISHAAAIIREKASRKRKSNK
jgi:GTP pyrophosphokinase